MPAPDPAPPQGPPVTGFAPPPRPGPALLSGLHVTLERLDPDRHAPDLFDANRGHDRLWAYLPYGPFDSLDVYRAWQQAMAPKDDPFFYALRDRRTGRVGGLASFLRIEPAHGVIEIGHIEISPAMQRSPAATEAICLMIRWAFDARYRRVEWKCDALNAPSMAAARRYGFAYEGTFRQHLIVKGHNRDTAWFAIVDRDWPALRAAHDAWLAPENFDPDGLQRQRLSDLTGRALQEP